MTHPQFLHKTCLFHRHMNGSQILMYEGMDPGSQCGPQHAALALAGDFRQDLSWQPYGCRYPTPQEMVAAMHAAFACMQEHSSPHGGGGTKVSRSAVSW